ncbi:MAG: septum formation protein Maf [Saprospiraceae bacterium]|nr:septum formation protein Maf [Saprospiraceae bacterium]
MHPLQRKLILASASPRRSQLLEQAGFNFEVRPQNIKEDYDPNLAVEEVAPYLAQMKAQAAKSIASDGEIILAADSVVILNGKIYEKPADVQDATRMLKALSGQEHTVITGVCLLDSYQKKVFSGVTTVQFETLSDQEISFYINAYKPFDKAGSYGIQEWIGLCKITKIVGTYANVMGLPVHLVYEELATW